MSSGTTYYLRVTATDEAGNSKVSDVVENSIKLYTWKVYTLVGTYYYDYDNLKVETSSSCTVVLSNIYASRNPYNITLSLYNYENLSWNDSSGFGDFSPYDNGTLYVWRNGAYCAQWNVDNTNTVLCLVASGSTVNGWCYNAVGSKNTYLFGSSVFIFGVNYWRFTDFSVSLVNNCQYYLVIGYGDYTTVSVSQDVYYSKGEYTGLTVSSLDLSAYPSDSYLASGDLIGWFELVDE